MLSKSWNNYKIYLFTYYIKYELVTTNTILMKANDDWYCLLRHRNSFYIGHEIESQILIVFEQECDHFDGKTLPRS